MPKFPTRDDLGKPADMSAGGAVISGDQYGAGLIARGAKSLGQDLQAVGASWQAEREKEDQYTYMTKLSEFDLAQEKKLDDWKRNITPDGTGFTDTYRQSYDTDAKGFLETVPPHMRKRLEHSVGQLRTRQEKNAYDYELSTRDKFHFDDVQKRLTGLIDDASAAPERAADHKIRGLAILNASNNSEVVKRKLRTAYLNDVDEYTINALEQKYANDPEKLRQLREDVAKSRRIEPTASGKGRRFGADVETAIATAVKDTGVDETMLRTFIAIESGGRPNTTTGSYKGALQLSDAEFRKHGGQGDIYDPVENVRSGAIKIKAEAEDFRRKHGREPTPFDLYLVHQQGVAGSANHLANPDRPAWLNMLNTGEGRQKAAAKGQANAEKWARAAIWGNVPDDVKAKYGSVENMTSKDFVEMWRDKYSRMGGGKGAAPVGDVTEGSPAADGAETARSVAPIDPDDVIVEHDGPVPFGDLKPERRRAILTKLGNSVRGYAKKGAEGLIERLRMGQTVDDETFKKTISPLTGQQKVEAESKWVQAKTFAEATRGLSQISDAEMAAREKQIEERRQDMSEPIETVKARRLALDEVRKKYGEERKVRNKDPAEGVMTAPTVLRARRVARDQGIQPLTPEYFELVVPALVEAQRAYGATPGSEMIITEQVARTLLKLPRGEFNDSTEKDFIKALAAAGGRPARDGEPAQVGRFEKVYGKRYAAQAFEQALKLVTKSKTQEAGLGIAAKLVRGEPVTNRDFERLRMMENLSAVDKFWARPERGRGVTVTDPQFFLGRPEAEKLARPSLSLGTDGSIMVEK